MKLDNKRKVRINGEIDADELELLREEWREEEHELEEERKERDEKRSEYRPEQGLLVEEEREEFTKGKRNISRNAHAR